MYIHISKETAKAILDMFDDWEEDFVDEHPEYYEGYIGATKDLLRKLGITREELEKYLRE